MKYAINQIALLKDGTIGTICKTELIDAKGYYTLSTGEKKDRVVRTSEIKTILGNVLSEIPGRSKKELEGYFKGKKANVKELKKFYALLASAKYIDDIIDVDVNINAKSELSYDAFEQWFNSGRVKEKSNISLNPYIGYVNIKVDDKVQIKMLISKMDENCVYPLFYKVNDMDLVSGPCAIDISQQWTLTPMTERNARAFRNEISTYGNMLFINEQKCFIPKDKLPNAGDVVKFKNYNPDTIPGYLNAINLYFAGKDIKIKIITPTGDVVFQPTDKGLRKEDYYCLVSDLDIKDLMDGAISEPMTKQI